jgi:hypothetical protein
VIAELAAEIDRVGGVSRLVVLSYSVDLGFLHEQLDRAMSGIPLVTVVANADCVAYSTALNRWRRLLPRLELLPVELPNRRTFHPKAVLLLGAEDVSLFVGSGNCGFAGWLENGELWARLRLSEEGAVPFHQFAALLEAISRYAPIDTALVAEIRARAAGGAQVGGAGLLWRVWEEPSIGDQLASSAQRPEAPSDVVVVCPWFDHDGVSLGWLLERLGNTAATVLVQRSETGLDPSALPPGAEIRYLEFARGTGRVNFYHSILYLIRWQRTALAFLGSASCTTRSMRARQPAGDAELMCRLPVTHREAATLLQLMERGVRVDDYPVDA